MDTLEETQECQYRSDPKQGFAHCVAAVQQLGLVIPRSLTLEPKMPNLHEGSNLGEGVFATSNRDGSWFLGGLDSDIGSDVMDFRIDWRRRPAGV